MTNLEKGFTAFLGGLIVISLATVLVKPGAQTGNVLHASGTALSSSLSAAQGNPVSS